MEAIIGYHHLVNYKFYLDRKTEIRNIYNKFLENKVKVFETKSEGNLYKYICFLKNAFEKKKLVKYLNKNNIFLSGDVYAKPLHQYQIIKKEKKIKLPNSSDICSRHICLPIYYGLKNKEIRNICLCLLTFFKKKI